MQILRNRELCRMLAVMLAVMAAGSVAGFCFDWRAGCLAFLVGLLVAICAIGFAGRQYRRLRRLSACLERICAGDYSLDVRNNDEGELSILQNDIHKVTRILREQNQRLTEEKTRLADSMSDISHQLKTPLTSMMMLADLLQSPDLPPDEARAVLEKACEPLSISAELREQTLLIDVPEGLRVKCDLNWTAEALLNVIKNCVEHTPRGGTVTVSARQNPLYALFMVADTGEGIAKEDQPHLFERFYRGKNASPDSVGIGLAMARTILRAQGGEISVRSSPGQGSIFSLKVFNQAP